MKKIKKKIPAYLTGKEIGNNLLENAADVTSLLTNPFTKSTATTGGEAAMQSIADVSKGAMTGLAVGGPIGAAVGAAIGGIGKKGESAEMTSFTDYDEGTLGTGLIGAFTNKKLRRERRRIKTNAYNNRDAVRGTEYLASEYDQEYGDLDTNTFEYGGILPSELAYVDDGELIQTPNSINYIPEQGNPVDSNLVNLPQGSRILSNSLKVPGSKDTFAEKGKKIMNNRKSLYSDKFAQNAKDLNDMNNTVAFNDLFDLQEEVKRKKGIKPKTKQIQAFDNGGTYYDSGWDTIYNGDIRYLNRRWPRKINRDTIDLTDQFVIYNPSNSRLSDSNNSRKTIRTINLPEVTVTATRNKKAQSSTDENTVQKLPSFNSTIDFDSTSDPLAVSDLSFSNRPRKLSIQSTKIPDSLTPLTQEKVNQIRENSKTGKGINFNVSGLGQILDRFTEAIPAISNLFADAQTVDPIYNPYANSILNAVRGRRFNINPLIRDINRNRSIANYNADQLNTNTGANLAFRLANAVNSNNAISAARAEESNINNQYLADYANIANSLGQQWVNATQTARDYNLRSQAAARNVRRQGISQLSALGRNRELMRNQTFRDNAMLALYAPYLQSVVENNAFAEWLRQTRQSGNRFNIGG